MKRFHHYYSHRGIRKHKISSIHKFNVFVLVPFLIIALSVFISSKFFSPLSSIGISDIAYLLKAISFSFSRLFASYIISLVIGLFFAIVATSSRKMESFLLPIYDTLESVPILVFFPVIILFFISYKFFNAAAIFIISLNMIWNIVFAAIAGIKLIPTDILSVGTVFQLNKLQKLWKIFLPSLFPHIVTGSLLAWAEGWNMVIVAEVLKTYVPKAISATDLFGIGSVLVNASVSGDSKIFFGSVCVVVLAVVAINVFIWQPLLKQSEKYRFDI